MNPDAGFWAGKRVFLTGHTGFKGAWAAAWLLRLGACPFGYALAPETAPNLCALLRLEDKMPCVRADIRDPDRLRAELTGFAPDVVLHLAAQSLVRPSYTQPAETFATNVIGTINVLQAARATDSVRAVVVVTSDKCYENREWDYAYRETDALGGADPYSASKACAELVTASWRASFFQNSAAVASARAGNVIGGGDWAPDRLVPDCVLAFAAGRPVELRNPDATRPWQHVLEPLAGYLLLAEKLVSEGDAFAQAWNFGPTHKGERKVADVVEMLRAHWGADAAVRMAKAAGPHEAGRLAVDSSKARAHLGWAPRLTLREAVGWTADWYRRQLNGQAAADLVDRDIEQYENASKSL